jgi:valyl-tRNA synthetase
VEVYGDVAGFEADISQVMHVERVETLDEEPDVESVVTGIDLDYAVVGPEFGADVPEIEAGIEAGDYELVGDELHVAGHELSPEMFSVEEERRFTGEGEMLEAGDAIVILRAE